jgi:hypothetical protein
VVVAKSARVSDSAIGLVVTRHLEGQNVRVLMTASSALAFGGGFGLALGLLLWLRRPR